MSSECSLPRFAIFVRSDQQGAYRVAVTEDLNTGAGTAQIDDMTWDPGSGCLSANTLAQASHTPDTNWHTYRVEVHDNYIKLLIDGTQVVEATDNHHLTGAATGLWSYHAVLNVRSFKVIAL